MSRFRIFGRGTSAAPAGPEISPDWSEETTEVPKPGRAERASAEQGWAEPSLPPVRTESPLPTLGWAEPSLRAPGPAQPGLFTQPGLYGQLGHQAPGPSGPHGSFTPALGPAPLPIGAARSTAARPATPARPQPVPHPRVARPPATVEPLTNPYGFPAVIATVDAGPSSIRSAPRTTTGRSTAGGGHRSTAPTPAGPDPAEAAALAGAFAVDYLSWDQEDPDRRGRVLLDYLQSPADDPARLGWSGRGRQRAEFALPGLVRSDGIGRVLVDVRVRVTPYRAIGEHRAASTPAPRGEPEHADAGVAAVAPAPTGRGWRSSASRWVRISVPVLLDGGRLVIEIWEQLADLGTSGPTPACAAEPRVDDEPSSGRAS